MLRIDLVTLPTNGLTFHISCYKMNSGDVMSFNTAEINSVKINFDKEKTEAYRNSFNSPCDCQNCRSFDKGIEALSTAVSR